MKIAIINPIRLNIKFKTSIIVNSMSLTLNQLNLFICVFLEGIHFKTIAKLLLIIIKKKLIFKSM